MMIPIVLFGCLHNGSQWQDEDMALAYRDFVKNNPRAKAILLGDNFECSIPAHKKETMWDQTKTPHDQYMDVVKFYTPIKHKIIGACTSNHSARIYREVSLDIDAQMAETLGYLDDHYKGVGGVLNLKIGKVDYSIAIAHGKSAGIDPWRDAKKMLAIHPFVDIVALSHTHRCVWEWHGQFDNKDELRKIAFVRTGSLLNYARYARDAMYTPNIKGFTILWLNDREKEIRPDTSGYLPKA